MSATNPIDVIEAAYELHSEDKAWLRNLATLLQPLVDGGRGVVAYTFDFTQPNQFPDPLLIDMDPQDWATTLAMSAASAKVMQTAAAMHVHPEPFGTLIDSGRRAGLGDLREIPEVAPFFARGIGDAAALRTVEPGGKGLVVCGLHHREHRVDRRATRLWTRVAAHVAAGRRLRTIGATTEADVDAIMTPNGRVDDARGEGATRTARDALRDAVLRIERARGKARRTDAEGATEAWTALVSGRWSLVDRFERGGRRFLVARRNGHALPDPRALGERERAVAHLAALGKSNKLVAYELGLAESTVATHLASAMRKLGAKSRVGLVGLLAQLALPVDSKK
jgi:DNA-binding CsgD family transcriptional regulator